MVRRVKAYLNNMKIITDEDKLHQMSLECEPPVGGIPMAIQTVTSHQQSQVNNNEGSTLNLRINTYIK